MEKLDQIEHADLIEAKVKLYYKFTDTQLITIADLNFDADMTTCSSIFYEHDLMHRWMEGIDENIKIGINGVPVPSVSSTSFVYPIKGMGDRFINNFSIIYVDRKTNGALNIAASHPEEDRKWFGFDLKEKPEGTEYMKLDRMFRYLEKVDDNTSRHVVYSEITMTKDVTKDVLLNYVLKDRSIKGCKFFRENFDKIIDLYKARVNGEKKAFYDNLRNIYQSQEDDE